MNSYTKNFELLTEKKENLKWEEEYLIKLKEEIADLEKIVESSQITQLEKDFLETKEKIDTNLNTLIADAQRTVINIGRDVICKSVEKLSEESGIPIYVWNNICDLNSHYVPTTISKWEGIDFKDYKIDADTSVAGWKHSSAC